MKIGGDVKLYDVIGRVGLCNYRIHGAAVALAAGVFGVAGLILAAKRGGGGGGGAAAATAGRGPDEKQSFVPGLHNLGNNCFLNVVLQSLASCVSFSQFLHEAQLLFGEDGLHTMPLTNALLSLFEGLRIPHGERMILSPKRVMLAMDDYIPSFNLTRQQDSAEAFLHLLSSMKEEVSDCYVPHCSSLADISTFSQCQICIPGEDQSERERWHRYLLGPFDGILCSLLACKSCSSQLSMDFEFFNSLPLSPVLDCGGTIMKGTSLEDCLKQFTSAELIENYHCWRCWHNKTIKFLSTVEGEETTKAQLEKLKYCVGEDSCNCRNLFPLDGMLWSKGSSLTIKQLSVARLPKILCIQLQRASVNRHGELVKLQGHISFPMILDVFPFMKGGVEEFDINYIGKKKLQEHQLLISRFYHLSMQFDTQMLQSIYRPKQEGIVSEAVIEDEKEYTINESSVVECGEPIGESAIHRFEDYPRSGISSESDNKISKIRRVIPSKSYNYHLVSVVEHFGRVGSGHYAVYRKVRNGSDEDSIECSEPVQWFCASDSQVYSVSEEDVLAVEASLLFYERSEVFRHVPTVF